MTAPASTATKLAKLLRLNTKEQLPLCLNTAAQTKTDDGGAAAAINTSSSQMLNLSKEIITGRRYKRRKYRQGRGRVRCKAMERREKGSQCE